MIILTCVNVAETGYLEAGSRLHQRVVKAAPQQVQFKFKHRQITIEKDISKLTLTSC